MIKPELLTFNQLLIERLFLIPEYQRSYSWMTKQRKALFSDIEAVYEQLQRNDDAVHFMSTIVCLEKAKEKIGTTPYHKYEVVDGQQRLTSLIILLKCIELKMDKKDEDYRNLCNILVKSDKATTPILLMNHDEKQIFSDFIKKGKKPNFKNKDALKSDILLQDAISESQEFIENWCENKTLSDLYGVLKNNLYFVLHVIDNERLVYKIFEVLNSRGLIVEWLDRLKSIMMGILFENNATQAQLDTMHKTWSTIYSDMGINRNYGSMAMRYLAALNGNYSRIKSEEDCVSELVDKCDNDLTKTLEIASEISELIKNIKELEKKYFQSILMDIQHPRFLALCIEKSQFTKSQKSKLLDAWEHSTFKIFGLERKDARFKVGDYISLGQDIYQNTINYNDALKKIKYLSANCDIKKAVKELLDTNIYEEWSNGFKYLMYKRELFLAGKSKIASKTWKEIWLTSDTDSIEHILPQSSQYAVDERKKEKRSKIYKHRLGNLLILDKDKNSSLRAKDPVVKKDSYNDLFIEKEVAKMIQESNKWTKQMVESREKVLSDWILEQWNN